MISFHLQQHLFRTSQNDLKMLNERTTQDGKKKEKKRQLVLKSQILETTLLINY